MTLLNRTSLRLEFGYCGVYGLGFKFHKTAYTYANVNTFFELNIICFTLSISWLTKAANV